MPGLPMTMDDTSLLEFAIVEAVESSLMESPKTAKKRPTLQDVAKAAGVSVQTASQVLAKTPNVRIANGTREKVEAAAIEVNYQPNRMAQAMRKGKSHVAAVWMPVDRPIIGYLRVLNALSKVMRQSEYEMMVVGLESSVAFGGEGRLPSQWPVDGIIAYDSGRAVKRFRNENPDDPTPVLILGNEEFERGDTISWDVIGASHDLARDLILAGRKDLVHLSPRWVLENYPQEQRSRGYREAMAEAGLNPVLIGAEEESATAGAEALRRYLETNPVPQAITAFNDSMALGAIRVLDAAGVKVPEDCCVWGYGDFPESADARIPLSSLAIPFVELAEHGWKWMSERIADPKLATRKMALPVHRVGRSSSVTL